MCLYSQEHRSTVARKGDRAVVRDFEHGGQWPALEGGPTRVLAKVLRGKGRKGKLARSRARRMGIPLNLPDNVVIEVGCPVCFPDRATLRINGVPALATLGLNPDDEMCIFLEGESGASTDRLFFRTGDVVDLKCLPIGAHVEVLSLTAMELPPPPESVKPLEHEPEMGTFAEEEGEFITSGTRNTLVGAATTVIVGILVLLSIG